MNLKVFICPALKLLYYGALILYHCLDFVMDWYSFHVLLTDGTISGVPASSNAVKVLFGISCVCCTICTAILLRVYSHYIKYHYLCIYFAAFHDYGPVGPIQGSESIQIPDDVVRESVSLFNESGRNTINPSYTLAELVVSVVELTFKDDIQTGLLFWVSTAYIFTKSLSWHSLLFSICSLLAHLKLFICFVTKLFHLGEGKGGTNRHRRLGLKCCLCVFGCVGSAAFEGLTIAYLSTDKPVPIPRSLTLDTATTQILWKESVARNRDRRHSTPLEESAGISRSCDSLDYDAPTDNYVTDMHLIVLKDILRCWRNMLCKPTISLAGACWEDFEIVKSQSWPKVSEDQSSMSLLVRLRKESTNLDSNNRCGQYIAKVKCKTPGNGNKKSPFDQDYSVCTSLESHENVFRVLAYFRGEIQSPILGMDDNTSPFHTTISISDQVPMQTCAEFVAQSKNAHSDDPLSHERTVCLLMLQCLKAVMHLHDSGFTHGNLNLNNLFLIKHNRDFQLLIGNFGKSQPLAKERRTSTLYSKIDDSPTECSDDQNDFIAISELFTSILHQDQNGNGTHASKTSYSALSQHLHKASERLRDGSANTYQVVCFLQALLWGPFKLGENIVIVSESRMSRWLDRQRSEFIARLAMDEALARTVGESSRKFSMEDLLLCDYLTLATPGSLVRTQKCWFLAT